MKRGSDPDFRSPVLALSIFDYASLDGGAITEHTKLLVVVRRPETNPTHPNVVSVPTQRIPAGWLDSRFQAVSYIENGLIAFCDGPEVDSLQSNGHDPIIYATRAILSQKLGVSDALESHALAFRAAPRALMRGVSYYPDFPESGREEHILMMNLIVTITRGADLFPPSTESYSHILWADVATFLHSVRAKDPTVLGLGAEAVEYCVHGLCVWSTYNNLARELGLDFYKPAP